MAQVIVAERFFLDSFGVRTALRVTFDSTGLIYVSGGDVQVALESVDGALVLQAAAFVALAAHVDVVEAEALAAQVAADVAQATADTAILAAAAAQATADAALAAAGAGGRTFAFFVS